MSTKPLTNKAIQELASNVVRNIADGARSITSTLQACKTQQQVLLFIETMRVDTLKLPKNEQPYVTRVWQNGITKFIHRCRKGENKTPPAWFDTEMSISFKEAPYTFAKVGKRKSNKADDDAKAQKALEDKAKELLADKATLTKAQEAKVTKAEAQAKAESAKAQALAKQWQANAEKSDAALAKQGQALQALQVKHNALVADYEKALRQIEALKKALALAKVEASVIEALINHA